MPSRRSGLLQVGIAMNGPRPLDAQALHGYGGLPSLRIPTQSMASMAAALPAIIAM